MAQDPINNSLLETEKLEKFNRFLKVLQGQVTAPEGTPDDKWSNFDKGYTYGILLGQAMKGMTETEMLQFDEGFSTGFSIGKMERHQLQ